MANPKLLQLCDPDRETLESWLVAFDAAWRGGGWSSGATSCRSAMRDRGPPGFRDYRLGFRLAFSSVDASGR